MKLSVKDLIKAEGWETKDNQVLVYGKTFPAVHPVLIHLKLYRDEPSPELKYRHMFAAHNFLWPKDIDTWHSWTEDRFKEHCAGWKYMSWAGGASIGKSNDAAKVALLFWLADPKNRGAIIASTTLESLSSRVWGYVTRYLSSMAVKIPYQYLGGNSPKILYPVDRTLGEIRDTTHGIFAVAARQGSDESTINTWIGRHAKNGTILVLDECTDLPPAISKAFVNLEAGDATFQCIGIGNSNSWNDLHGMMSTPKNGIESVDPMVHTKWETTQKNGVCLFFNCYNSPAIHEPDPIKRKRLGKFLITQEQINEKEITYGKDSDAFYRFVMGFWRPIGSDRSMVSKAFLDSNNVVASTEWLGIEPLHMVAGLDPAFSTGGDQCVLRLGVLGQDVNGGIVLDFRNEELLFRIPISARSGDSAEIQIAKRVTEILGNYNIPLHHLCLDSNGQGRALGGTIYLQARAIKPPVKIYSTRAGEHVVNSFDVKIVTAHELWFTFRQFIEHGQIKGLDHVAFTQFTKRLTFNIDTKGNPCKPRLEPKIDYKRRMAAIMPALAHSPDEADAATLCLQSAIMNFGFSLGQKREIRKIDDFVSVKMFAHEKEVEMREQKHAGMVIRNGFGLDVTSFGKKPGVAG